MSLEETRELWIHLRIVWGAQRELPSPRECHQPRRDASLIPPLAWRNEFRHHFPRYPSRTHPSQTGLSERTRSNGSSIPEGPRFS